MKSTRYCSGAAHQCDVEIFNWVHNCWFWDCLPTSFFFEGWAGAKLFAKPMPGLRNDCLCKEQWYSLPSETESAVVVLMMAAIHIAGASTLALPPMPEATLQLIRICNS